MGYNGNEETINSLKIAKMLKDVIQLSSEFDFGGIKSFESERIFISSTKSIVYSNACKNLPRSLQNYLKLTPEGDKA